LKRETGRRFLRRLFCGAACFLAVCFFTGDTIAWGEGRHSVLSVQAQKKQLPRSAAVDKVRLTWPLIPGAVRYQVVLLSGPSHIKENVIYAETVSAPGTEITLDALRGADPEKTYWTVCGLHLDESPLGKFSEPKLLSKGERRPVAPLILSEYATMQETPIYLVYAWVSVHGASSYEVEVWREEAGKRERVRHYYSYEPVFYDETPLGLKGEYSWRVRALDGNGRKWSDWSEPEKFSVHAPVTVAALGDSITHGGGAVMTPPSRALYCWESYVGLPVKNLGKSGDSTYDLLQRFERDVLPFEPKYLVIMGGVNDFRVGAPAFATIQRLSLLAEKCRAHGITPVFATATPICPRLMAKVWDIEPAAWSWKTEQRAINEWIMAQPYAVDVATPLLDENGELKESLTTDGLHPDAEAKKIIGETIGKYLKEKFGLK
jgi:lysophospholipase L1-like esterase